MTATSFVFDFSEPVNRKQSNPSLFDTHRSPARRSHIRLVEVCGKIAVRFDAKCIIMCDSSFFTTVTNELIAVGIKSFLHFSRSLLIRDCDCVMVWH